MTTILKTKKSNRDKDDEWPIIFPEDRDTSPIDWDTVTDDELKRRASVFSYNADEAKKKLKTPPLWVKFIVAHLYVDHILSQLLVENLKDPSAYTKKKPQKICSGQT